VEFEWDERKRRKVIKDHGLNFRDVMRSFLGPRLVDHDHRHSEDEDRWFMLGHLDGDVIAVIYTERESTIRLITARKATNEEAQLYYEEFFGEPL
jgi:uncharacterized DUF497 family protein